jgi:hypothetical protein
MSKTVDKDSLYLALSAAGVALSACSLASVYLKPRRRYAEEVRAFISFTSMINKLK